MDRLLSSVVAAVIEAWHELRIHRLRVLLSLVGVAVAIAALSATSALAKIGEQALVETYERDGRPALLTTYTTDASSEEGLPGLGPEVRTAFEKVSDDFDITYRSVRATTLLRATSVDTAAPATTEVQATLVDPDYAAMHRVVVDRGRWLEDADAQNRSPAVVVEPSFLTALGLEDTTLPTSVELTVPGAGDVRATVVGVTSTGSRFSDSPVVYALWDAYLAQTAGTPGEIFDATWEMWVPVPGSEELAFAVAAAMRAELPGYQSDTSRNDYLAYGGIDELGPVRWVVTAVSGLILLLGALSLLNVTLITVQQRVREIGIRRSFGATTGRVFFSVVMESVVATTVAGVVGVMLAIAAVSGPWTAEYLLQGIDDVPPFPLSAAFVGLGAALGVGALAGVLPALVASRVRIINAIRF